MNTNILNEISRVLLWAWYLDLEFIINLIEKYELDFEDIHENIELNFWESSKKDINLYIYEALYQIAHIFIDRNKDLFKTESDEFEICTNYLDSYIYFTSDKVQDKFEWFYY